MSYIIKKQIINIWEKAKKNDEELFKTIKIPENIVEIRKFYINDNSFSHTLCYAYPNSTKGKLPIIIYVHGGGWFYGNIDTAKPFIYSLASYNFAVIAMNYRLLPKSNAKKMIQDIYDALHFAYNDKEVDFFDFSNVYIIGDSAGGMLESLVLGCENSGKIRKAFKVKKLPFDIKKVCLNHPVSYLRSGTLVQNHKITNLLAKHEYKRELFGSFFKPFRKIYRYASDFDSILNRVDHFPPSLVITSSGDFNYREQTLMAYEDLKKRKINVRLIDNSKEPNVHVYNVIYINDLASIDTNESIVLFFNEDLFQENK